MKKNHFFFLLLASVVLAANSYAQFEPAWNIGIGAGESLGINEAISQSFNPQFHLYGLWLNGLAPHLSLQGDIGSAKISTPKQGGYSEYSTNLIPIDIRIRYAPFKSPDWQPYLYAGIGLLHYNVASPLPSNVSPDAKLSGTTAFLPLGIGLYHSIDKRWAVESAVEIDPSFSDDLNPVHDNRNDAYWGFTIGITYSFSDGQSQLSDEFDFGVRGTTRILINVIFDSATAALKKESESQLSEILAALNNHPDIEVEFRDYTDDSGDFNTSMALTQERAESVKVWLVSRGISATRISTQGYGPHNPLVANDTPEHRKMNTRMEIVRMK